MLALDQPTSIDILFPVISIMSLTGVFKITLLNLTLTSKDLEDKNVVELTIGNAKSQTRAKTKDADFGRDIHILKFENAEKIEIVVG